MKKFLLSIVVFLSFLSVAKADGGIYGSFAIVDGTYYQCKGNDATKFNGHNFGSFTDGSSLILKGGEIKTWKNGGTDITGAYLYYRVYKTGTTPSSFTEVKLDWKENGVDGNGNNQKWAKTGETTNLLSGLSAGDYTIEVYFKATSNEGDKKDDDNGNNYKATFKVTTPNELKIGNVTITPKKPTRTDKVTITLDANGTDLAGESKVYFHSGVATDKPKSKQFDKVKGNWGKNDDVGEMNSLGNNKWQIVLPSIDAYYSLTNDDDAFALNFLFRNADGKKKEDNGGKNYHVDIEPGNYFLVTEPTSSPHLVKGGEEFPIKAEANKNVDWTLDELNPDGTVKTVNVNSQQNVQNYDFNHKLNDENVLHYFRLTADFGNGVTKTKTFEVKTHKKVSEEPLPPGAKKGINYNDDDGTVTFVLHTPTKTTYKYFDEGDCSKTSTVTTKKKEVVYLIGDFNDWKTDDAYLLNRTADSDYWHITLTKEQLKNLRLKGNKQSVFQYLVDGDVRIGDPYTHQVSDPDDNKISPATYPDLISYPYGKTTGRASVVHLEKPAEYTWKVPTFKRTKKRNKLNIYELHFRDFTQAGTYEAATTKLDYLKELGITCIHVMPVSEFEGNDSWGYNPDYYFAADKAYGTPNDLKKFIDEAHQRGIAVVNDLVLNHAFSGNPNVKLYWDKANNRPASDSPWFNPEHKGIYDKGGHWGADWNHGSEHTRAMVDDILKYWMDEYHFDGFRFDFTKGFTQKNPNSSDPWASKYDACRVEILKRMADTIPINDDKWTGEGEPPYVIFEHLANDTEDKELADFGVLLWSGSGPQEAYMEMAMGTNKKGFWNSVYESRKFQYANYMSYMESHDEERIGYKVKKHGKNKDGTTEYLSNRLKLVAAFNLMLPGPRMVWQFGELGYDKSINENGRTGEKESAWELGYDKDPERQEIYRLYSLIFKLRNEYKFYPAESKPEYDNMGSDTDWQRKMRFWAFVASNPSLNKKIQIIPVGNFDAANDATIKPGYDPDLTGTWFKYNGDPAVDGTPYPVNSQFDTYNLPTNDPVYILTNADLIPPKITPETISVGAGISTCYTVADESLDYEYETFSSTTATPTEGFATDNSGKVHLYITEINGTQVTETFTLNNKTITGLKSLKEKTLQQGKNTVHWVAIDDFGNKAECDQTINVCQTSDLIISEYVEPKKGEKDKLVEIYNGTCEDVDLSKYKLGRYENGNVADKNLKPLTGTLASGEFKVFSYTTPETYTGAVTKLGKALRFTGDDPIILLKDDEVIDMLGIIGGTDFAKDVTLRRKNSVQKPTAIYKPEEWVKLKNTSEKIHTENIGKKTPLLHIKGNEGYVIDKKPICEGISVTFTANGLGEYEFYVNGKKKQDASTTDTFTTTELKNNDVVTVKLLNGTCEDTDKGITMEVAEAPTATVSATESTICSGEDAVFNIIGTASSVVTYTLGSTTAQKVTLSDLGTATVSATSVTSSQTLILTHIKEPVAGCEKDLTAIATVTVNPKVTPVFTQVDPICKGESFTLPTTSTNSVTGVWSPAINTTATTEYTFTPDAGQCAGTVTMTVTVNPKVTPTFTEIAPICESESFTLSTTSTNSVTGTWSPAINTTATTEYTFTPDAGQCAGTVTMTVTVNPKVTPTFTQVAPICEGESFTLPTTSTNGVTGTWSPAINTSKTTEYTFTPSGATCAKTVTMTVTVNTKVTPTFTEVGSVCEGEEVILPETSTNSITGTWSLTSSTKKTKEYTFTPNAGQCATTATMKILVNALPNNGKGKRGFGGSTICKGEEATLTFDALNGSFTTPYSIVYKAQGGTITWTQSIDDKGKFSFTVPEKPAETTIYEIVSISNATCTRTTGIKGSTAKVEVVNAGTDGTLTICKGTIPTEAELFNALGGSPDTGGTWTNVGNVYTYKPKSKSSCTSKVIVTEEEGVTPTFTQVDPICEGESFTLPTTSTNSVTGTWSPAINTSKTTEYTFTPSGATCAKTVTMTVTVNSKVTPIFTEVGSICEGEEVILPETSTNSITGTWSLTSSTKKTKEYTFTPNAGQCATTATMKIAVNKLPNNYKKTGFKGGKICKGEDAVLTFKALKTGFATPYKIKYRVQGTTTEWEQDITKYGEVTFTVPVNPTETTVYELVSISNATCTRTTAFGRATAKVTVQEAPNAGENGTLTICSDTTPTEDELFAALQGTPDTGGTWTNTGNVYTYTVKAKSPCTDDAKATVTVNKVEGANAGTDGTLPVCEGTTSTEDELFAALGGTPTAGGTWTHKGTKHTYTVKGTAPCGETSAVVTVKVQKSPNNSRSGFKGSKICKGEKATLTFDALNGSFTAPYSIVYKAQGGTTTWTQSIDNKGKVTFTVPVKPTATTVYELVTIKNATCERIADFGRATAKVTVIEPANAGTDGTLTVCNGTTPTKQELFAALGGTPDKKGKWTNAGNIYTYTVKSKSPCTSDATAKVTVTEVASSNAGLDGVLTICEGTTPTEDELFAALGGTPTAGGAWTHKGTKHTYTVKGTAPCGETSAVVTVKVQKSPNNSRSGFKGSKICKGEEATLTFDALNGSFTAPYSIVYKAQGGTTTWTQSIDNKGKVTFIVPENPTATTVYELVAIKNATCERIADFGRATAKVTVIESANAGTDGTLTVCNGTTPTKQELFAALGGTPDKKGKWTNVGNVYTYTVKSKSPCTDDAKATVTVNKVEGANSGTDGTLPVCEGTTPTEDELFAALGGTPTAGGTWTHKGTKHTYTVKGTAPCGETSAVVTVKVQKSPNNSRSGFKGSKICKGEEATLTFDALNGSFTTPYSIVYKAQGGTTTWTQSIDNKGKVTFTVPEQPTATTVYELVTIKNATCERIADFGRATAKVTVIEPANAGTDGTLTITDGAKPTNKELFKALGGNPDKGGSWTNVGNVYTYTVKSKSPCTSDATAKVTVVEEAVVMLSVDKIATCPDEMLTFTATGGQEYEFFVDGTSVQAKSTNATFKTSALVDKQKVKAVVYDNGKTKETNTIVVSIKKLPNNSKSSGFRGNVICQGEEAILSFDALNASFTTPYTIVYKEQGGTTEWTQEITDKGKFSFTVPEKPRATTVYELVSISNATCERTTDFGSPIAKVTVINAGTDGVLTICKGVTPTETELFNALGGNPDTGGTWTNTGNIYTYTVNPKSPCTAVVKVLEADGVIPIFTQIAPIHEGESFELPKTSENNIRGTWSPAVNTNKTTEYTFTPNTGQCAETVTMTVTVTPKITPITISVKEECGQSVLTVNNYVGNLLWSTGETTESITVNSDGVYSVTQTTESGKSISVSKVVTVKPIPMTPTINVEEKLGHSVLTVTDYTGSLLWNTGETTESIMVFTDGEYSVSQLVDGCESFADSVTVKVKTVPSIDISMESEINKEIEINLSEDYIERGIDLAIEKIQIVTQPKNGQIEVMDNGRIDYLPVENFVGVDSFIYKACDIFGYCVTGTVSINIVCPDFDENLVIPHFISPNGDNYNDTWEIPALKVRGVCNQSNHVMIFNKFGAKVWDKENYMKDEERFDGYSENRLDFMNNKKLPSGTYFYLIIIDDVVKKTGYLHLTY